MVVICVHFLFWWFVDYINGAIIVKNLREELATIMIWCPLFPFSFGHISYNFFVSFQTWDVNKKKLLFINLLCSCLNLQNPGSVPSATSRLSPLPPEPYDRGATIDIPLDGSKVDWMWECWYTYTLTYIIS